jgi:hypothetical protein
MKRAMTCASVCGLLLACGSRSPMDGKGTVIFWTVTDTADNFVGCSDDPKFQAGFTPIPVGSNFEYRLEKDGQTATGVSCTSTDPNSCTDLANMVFQVAGDDLLLSQTQSSPTGTTGCNLEESLNWDLTDNGQTLNISISDDLSLTGNATACAQVDQAQKSGSPNGKGIQGCIVNFSTQASLGVN